ncbi:MAG: hypothetical protein LBJ63_07845 [Prevotellaceae bacterium]|jgi:hypothetical protein|nr:hypothetical protein [Prevotellaceae bacterium]
MLTSFDTDNILFQALNVDEVKTTITGGIYNEVERPDNSEKEDITINTITVTRTFSPQSGTSNVNIYVPDLKLNIKGQEQRKINKARLQELTELVITKLETANVQGVVFWVSNQTTLKEQGIYQHYTNLRIGWNIQII